MVVRVIDVCASCAEHEVGILQPQLWTLSKGQGTWTGANNVAISYRQVPRDLVATFPITDYWLCSALEAKGCNA